MSSDGYVDYDLMFNVVEYRIVNNDYKICKVSYLHIYLKNFSIVILYLNIFRALPFSHTYNTHFIPSRDKPISLARH